MKSGEGKKEKVNLEKKRRCPLNFHQEAFVFVWLVPIWVVGMMKKKWILMGMIGIIGFIHVTLVLCNAMTRSIVVVFLSKPLSKTVL